MSTVIKYSICLPSDLRKLCVENCWFTCASSDQWLQLYRANENGYPVEFIAGMVYACSDPRVDARKIHAKLSEARTAFRVSIVFDYRA